MIDLLLLVLVSPLVLASLVFLTETLGGAAPVRRSEREAAGAAPLDVAVLVPAHDEAAGVARVVAAIRADLPPGGRLLVVADNCSDETAAIARAAGADVTERRDAERRGKGFALDHGRAVLAASPPACVIVVDADTVPERGAIRALAQRAGTSGRPVQGAYTMDPGSDGSSTARFSAAAFYVKNVVRELGAARLGIPAILTGSGMAFPWAIFAGLPLATGHVTEDLMIGIACAEGGHAPVFEPCASIVGGGASDKGTATQRRRWESGFLEVARHSALPLVARGLLSGRPRLAWLGVHLLTPPLVLLLAADAAASGLLGVLALLGVGHWVVWVMAALFVGCGVSVGVALASHRRLDLLRDWHALPRYLVWKLRLSVAVLLRRETTWIRTERD